MNYKLTKIIKKNFNKLLLCLLAINFNAAADQYLYGKFVAGLQNSQPSNYLNGNISGVEDYGSYFGIHGDETITEQTSFIWQVEQLLDITSGQGYNLTTANGLIVPNSGSSSKRLLVNLNQLATSDSYIGIKSSWGEIKLGNLSNYLRSQMGAIDVFNYGNGANGLNTWSRTSANMILPSSFVYNSSKWNGFTVGFQYAYGNPLTFNTASINNLSTIFPGQGGDYFSGIYSFGIAWTYGNFKLNYGTQIWSNVGSYNSSASSSASIPTAAQYNNAYVNRLEASYNDPDGLFAAVGAQVTNGLGWYAWANSGGSFNNYIVNQGFNYDGLNQAEYQTQEFALSAGYHLGPWTPKLAYVYGNNIMYGGSIEKVLFGTANQIPNSGYQQLVAELDLNISPRTIVFANYGQTWFGNTLQNVSYCGLNCNNGNPNGTVNNYNAAFLNQSTFAIGMSHVF